MRSLSASRLQILWEVRIPNSLPFLFASLKVASSLAVVGAVIGEFTGAAGVWIFDQDFVVLSGNTLDVRRRDDDFAEWNSVFRRGGVALVAGGVLGGLGGRYLKSG